MTWADGLGASQTNVRRMTNALLYFPDYRSANPYQMLLYQHAGRDLYPRPGTIAEALVLHRQQSGGGRVIFHLHWEDAIYRQEASEDLAWHAAQSFLADAETFSIPVVRWSGPCITRRRTTAATSPSITSLRQSSPAWPT